MKELTKITDTLFCVEVPMDAVNIEVRRALINNWLIGYKVLIHLPLGNWELLGYCTDKEISFPVDEFIRKIYLMGEPIGFVGYADYQNEENCFIYSNLNSKDLSFRSLLLSKGLYWEHDLEVPVGVTNDKEEDVTDWHLAEKNLLVGKLVFFKLIKE